MQHHIIEDIVINEFRSLCSTCLHIDTCTYFKKKSDKVIIQCEMFEVDDSPLQLREVDGLCKTCDLADDCKLPGRRIGTWHCNEFK